MGTIFACRNGVGNDNISVPCVRSYTWLSVSPLTNTMYRLTDAMDGHTHTHTHTHTPMKIPRTPHHLAVNNFAILRIQKICRNHKNAAVCLLLKKHPSSSICLSSRQTVVFFLISANFQCSDTTACGHRMAHRKWKETKQQPCLLPGPAVPGCSLVSFHFL